MSARRPNEVEEQQERKLPQWARSRLWNLRKELDEKDQEIAELRQALAIGRGQSESPRGDNVYLCQPGGGRVWLGPDPMIEFWIGQQRINVDISGDKILVDCNNGLQIFPVANNSVRIREVPREAR